MTLTSVTRWSALALALSLGEAYAHSCPESSTLSTYVEANTAVDVGSIIPAGKRNLRILMEANSDMDLQLYDVRDTRVYPEGQAIVAWCQGECNKGILGGSNRAEKAVYNGATVEYSGYHGYQPGQPGKESIILDGLTTTDLRIRAYSAVSGNATVQFLWERSEGCEEPDTQREQPTEGGVRRPNVDWLQAANHQTHRTTMYTNVPEDVLLVRRGQVPAHPTWLGSHPFSWDLPPPATSGIPHPL